MRGVRMAIWAGTSFVGGVSMDKLQVFDSTHFENYDNGNGDIVCYGVGKTDSYGAYYYASSDTTGEQQYVRVFPNGSSPHATVKFSIRNVDYYSFDGNIPTVRIYNSSGQNIWNLENVGGASKDWYFNSVDTDIYIESTPYWFTFYIELEPTQWRASVTKSGGGGGLYYQSGWTSYLSGYSFDYLKEYRFSGYSSAGGRDSYFFDDLEHTEQPHGPTYRLVCDYDGTCSWSGTGRYVNIMPTSLSIGDYDNTGKVFERADMPWDTTKVVGSREYRKKNLTTSGGIILENETDARILESWCMKFASDFVPLRPFDYIKYYDASGPSYNTVSEMPQEIGYGNVYFDSTSDYLYIGSRTQQFTEIDVWLDRNGVGGTYQWQYSSGDGAWTNFGTAPTNGTFTGSAKISWTAPGGWVKSLMTSLDSTNKMYYVRCYVTATPTTTPRVIFIKRHRPISMYIMTTSDGYSYSFWRKNYVGEYYYPNGWAFKSVSRILTAGQPNLYSQKIELVEVNY